MTMKSRLWGDSPGWLGWRAGRITEHEIFREFHAPHGTGEQRVAVVSGLLWIDRGFSVRQTS